MDKLVKLAMLGNRKAQEEITKRGKLLPCPLCGESENLMYLHGIGVRVQCNNCTSVSGIGKDSETARKKWNTRPKLVTFCGECIFCLERKWCEVKDLIRVEPDDFCNYGESASGSEGGFAYSGGEYSDMEG